MERIPPEHPPGEETMDAARDYSRDELSPVIRPLGVWASGYSHALGWNDGPRWLKIPFLGFE